MIIFDINILVYAHREDQQGHEEIRARLETRIESGEEFGLTALTADGFVRVVTNPKFPNGPTPLDQALAVIDSLARNRNACWLSPGQRHWETFSSICRESGAVGKTVADAQHAAVAIEHAATWVSCDEDFLRFVRSGLRFEKWELPRLPK